MCCNAGAYHVLDARKRGKVFGRPDWSLIAETRRLVSAEVCAALFQHSIKTGKPSICGATKVACCSRIEKFHLFMRENALIVNDLTLDFQIDNRT